MLLLNKLILIGYAESFVSFLLKNRELKKYPIKDIILFGSVARGDFDKTSDIDIFIDMESKEDIKELNDLIKKILIKFYKSQFYSVFALNGVRNEIKVKVGILDEWRSKRSIISDGIILYGKYKYMPSKTNQYTLIAFSPIKDITKRNRVIRKLIGRKEKKYKKEGLLGKFGGKQLSQRVVIIPTQHANNILDLFSKEKIDYQIFDIWHESI